MTKKTKLRYTAVIFIIVVILFSTISYIYNKPHRNIKNETPILTITSDSLYYIFENKEHIANKQYLNKTIEVSGKIQKTDTVNKKIFLKANGMGAVICSFEANEFKKIKTSDSITVKGQCTGFLMDVNLMRCVVIKQ